MNESRIGKHREARSDVKRALLDHESVLGLDRAHQPACGELCEIADRRLVIHQLHGGVRHPDALELGCVVVGMPLGLGQHRGHAARLGQEPRLEDRTDLWLAVEQIQGPRCSGAPLTRDEHWRAVEPLEHRGHGNRAARSERNLGEDRLSRRHIQAELPGPVAPRPHRRQYRSGSAAQSRILRAATLPLTSAASPTASPARMARLRFATARLPAACQLRRCVR